MYSSTPSGSRPSPMQTSGGGGGGGNGGNDGHRMRTTFAPPAPVYNKPLPSAQFRQYPPGPNPSNLSRRAVSGFQNTINASNNTSPLNENGMGSHPPLQQQQTGSRTPVYSSNFGSPLDGGQGHASQPSRSQHLNNNYNQDNHYGQQDHYYQPPQQYNPPHARGPRSNQGRYTDGGSGRYDNRGDDQSRMYNNNVATPSDGDYSTGNMGGYDNRQHGYDYGPDGADYGNAPMNAPGSQHHRTGSGVGGGNERVSTTQLLRQMSQVAGDVATCVHQNELVISLLERLVAVSESLAAQPNHNVPQNFQGPTPPTHPSHSANQSMVGSTPGGGNNAMQNPSPGTQPQQQQQQPQQQQPQQQQPQQQQPQQQFVQHHLNGPNTQQASSSSGLTPHSVDPNLTRRSSLHADVDMLRANEQNAAQQVQPALQNTNNDSLLNATATGGVLQNDDTLNRHLPSQQQENESAFQSLGDAFDDPLNFIATPASTTHHHLERTMPMSSATRSTQQGNVLHAPELDGHVGSGATPHSGPPRYDSSSQNANEIGGQHNNRIPSPIFSESVPAGDDSFPSFDLSVDLAPRRGSRRISLRNAAIQRQHLQHSQQRDTQANAAIDNQQSVSYSVPPPSETTAAEPMQKQNASRADMVIDSEPSPKSQPVVRKKGTRGRKRKAILGRDSLRSNAQYPSPGSASADAPRTGRVNDMTMQEAGYDDSAWADWIEARPPPPAAVRNLPPAKYKSIKEVRMERKQKTNRSLATIGRIPLKQYLEVGGDAEYRAVRRLARTVYNTWLEPNVRLAKQDPHRLTACFHRIEYAFPILGDCEGHWKARELMLQVIDNAIDEVAFQKRKEARLSGNDVNAAPARRGRKPKPRPVVEPVQVPKRRKRSEIEPEEEEDFLDEEEDDDDDDDDLDDYDDDDDDDDDDDSDDSEEEEEAVERRQNGYPSVGNHQTNDGSIRRRRAYTTGNDASDRADAVAVDRSMEALDPSIANVSMSGNSLWNAGVGGRLYTSSADTTGHRSTTNQHLYSDSSMLQQQHHPTQNDQQADWSAARDALLEASAADADRNNQFANRSYSRRNGGNTGMMAW